MYKRIVSASLAFFPLVAVNGYGLAASYFERGNSSVNTNLWVLFLSLSLLIAISKLFFDFFLTVVTTRCVGLEPDSGKTLSTLLHCMLPQWAITLAGLVLSRLLFGNSAQISDLILFAVAHTVYYGCAAIAQFKSTGKKAFSMVYGAVCLVCWIYAIVTLLGLLAK